MVRAQRLGSGASGKRIAIEDTGGIQGWVVSSVGLPHPYSKSRGYTKTCSFPKNNDHFWGCWGYHHGHQDPQLVTTEWLWWLTLRSP